MSDSNSGEHLTEQADSGWRKPPRPEALHTNSDHALYVAKRSGKGRHMQYAAML
ncbi:hypothetical protein ACSBOB_11830 [Mesorhizobium sp. ASY16-5R]|uniref:hypothetical protein n=1 Tax=Mesorhizobium sp. ASY16-5R TaxID=3445772 RepID=UPI003F9EC3C2